jgi:hypothetical protein
MAVACNQIAVPALGKVLQATCCSRCTPANVLATLLCLTLGGCALSGTEIEALKRGDAPAPSTVQSVVVAEFRLAKLTGNPQVSDLHETTGPQPGDWTLCFKSDGSDKVVHYSVFFRNDKAVTTRPAAIMDGCQRATYHPLEPPLPHWPPPG